MLLSPRRTQEEQVWAGKSGVLFGRMKLDKPPPKFVADTATTCSLLNPNVASISPQHCASETHTWEENFDFPAVDRESSECVLGRAVLGRWHDLGKLQGGEKLEVSFLSVRGLLIAGARKPKSK